MIFIANRLDVFDSYFDCISIVSILAEVRQADELGQLSSVFNRSVNLHTDVRIRAIPHADASFNLLAHFQSDIFEQELFWLGKRRAVCRRLEGCAANYHQNASDKVKSFRLFTKKTSNLVQLTMLMICLNEKSQSSTARFVFPVLLFCILSAAWRLCTRLLAANVR